MVTGTVKFFNHKARSGFIRVVESGEEVYVKKSNCVDLIADNDKVQFEIIHGRKGPQATQVKKPDSQ